MQDNRDSKKRDRSRSNGMEGKMKEDRERRGLSRD